VTLSEHVYTLRRIVYLLILLLPTPPSIIWGNWGNGDLLVMVALFCGIIALALSGPLIMETWDFYDDDRARAIASRGRRYSRGRVVAIPDQDTVRVELIEPDAGTGRAWLWPLYLKPGHYTPNHNYRIFRTDVEGQDDAALEYATELRQQLLARNARPAPEARALAKTINRG
jgi:hypothetical protein